MNVNVIDCIPWKYLEAHPVEMSALRQATIVFNYAKDKAYSLVGTPEKLQWEDKVVAVVEARDGTILDVVRKIKPLDVNAEGEEVVF